MLPDSAQVAPDAFGPPGPAGSADPQAIAIAEQDFVDPSRTYGHPADAARAAAAVDYLAGELSTGPAWAGLDPKVKADMLDARQAVRASLGVAPGASSQTVVDDLLAAAHALDDGDDARARLALGPPAFTAPAEETLHRLADLPYIRSANIATHEVQSAEAAPTAECTACQGGLGVPP